MKNIKLNKVIISAVFISLGMVLPLITGQIKEIGDSLLPMHLVVLMCGFICGEKYGFLVGVILPPLRSVIFGMPPMYPNCVYMAAELATYGFTSGVFFRIFEKRGLGGIYISLLLSMLSGRIVWGVVKWLLYGLKGETFTFAAFLAGGFFDAIPGIILQLILVPTLTQLYRRYFYKNT